VISGGRLRWLRLGAAASEQAKHAAAASHPALLRPVAEWPRVEIVASHAGATGAVVRALCGQGVDGLVVSATGNGSVHAEMQAALVDVRAQGVAVLCSPRYGDGCWNPQAIDRLPMVDVLTPAKARVELMIRLMESARR
jgi:L-asparaginase